MFSLNKLILRYPYFIRILHLGVVLSFFTKTSFSDVSFYFQILLLFLVYGAWCRPFLKLVGYDLKKKKINLDGRFEKLVLLNCSWLFLLVPINLGILSFYSTNGNVYGIKLLIFIGILVAILINSGYSLKKKNAYIGTTIAFSLVKNFFIMFLASFFFLLFFLIQ